MADKLAEAVGALKRRLRGGAQIGIVIGSGLGCLTDEFQNPLQTRFEDIPHFPVSSVDGHKGELVEGHLSGIRILALSGRVHYYEGYAMTEVVFPIRVMAALDIEMLIITNAAGAINARYLPGDIVAIKDHINMMGENPLQGPRDFVDLNEAYNRRLRNMAQSTADALGVSVAEGVYAAITGPSYETPAEIKMLQQAGADMVGMSTVPEVIMANRQGLKILGLSLVTNMAAGMGAQALSHQEVIETGRKAAPEFKALVKGVVKRMAGERR